MTPVVPPFIVAEYTCKFASAPDGVSVTVRVVALYETVAVTSTFKALRSSIVEPLIVLAFIASLKTAEMLELTRTPVVPFAGVTDVTVGGVISPASVVNDQI